MIEIETLLTEFEKYKNYFEDNNRETEDTSADDDDFGDEKFLYGFEKDGNPVYLDHNSEMVGKDGQKIS